MISEQLVDGHEWWRIADPDWNDPLDPTFARARGGRWNPPDGWNTLYVNEDVVTARLNLKLFTDAWPYQPEDLRPEQAPVLIGLTLPPHQTVADVHSPAGLAVAGLPATYPLDSRGQIVPHQPCQRFGTTAHAAGLRGVRCRSATLPLGEGRELAWFPATTSTRATLTERRPFADWYWA